MVLVSDGNSGPAASIDTISAPTASLLTASILSTTYANAQFSVNVLYSLVGGAPGSGTSDLSEQISIQNLTRSALSFDFFQYADFNLGGTPNNDTGQLDQNGKKYGGVTQYNSPGCRVSENVDAAVSQPANYGEIGTGSGASSTILNLLKNSGFTHLNDQNNTPPGGGNVNWGLEWDANIAPGGTFIISKDLNIEGVVGVAPVPEPAAWSLYCWDCSRAVFANFGRVAGLVKLNLPCSTLQAGTFDRAAGQAEMRMVSAKFIVRNFSNCAIDPETVPWAVLAVLTVSLVAPCPR